MPLANIANDPLARCKVRRKTPIAAAELGIRETHLNALVRSGKLGPPSERDSSGHYLWSDEDLEAARAALRTDRRRKVVTA